jgi:hypothetical protein
VGALESGAGEKIIRWCLAGRRVGQISPVEIYNGQKTAKLTDVLGRVAVQKMGYLFMQRSETPGGHIVTEKCDLGGTENTLRQVDENPVHMKSAEESP